MSSRLGIILLLAVSAASQSFIFAVLPPIARQIGISDVEVGLISTISALGFILTAPGMGALTERYGCKPFLIGGLAAGAVVNAIFAVALWKALDGALEGASAYVIMLVSRAALNVAWAGMFPAAQAYTVATVSDEARSSALALNGAAHGAGFITGPVIAWALTGFGEIAPFLGIAAITFACMLYGIISISESTDATRNRLAVTSKPSSSLAEFWPNLGIGATALTCSTLTQQLVAFRMLDKFSLSSEAAGSRAGLALSLMALALVGSQLYLASGRLTTAPESRIQVGVAFGAAGAIIFAAAGLALDGNYAFVAMMLSLVMSGLGLGLIIPSNAVILSIRAGTDEQGRAAGFLNSAQVVGVMLGPLLGTVLYKINPEAPFLVAAALFLTIYALQRRAV